MVGVRMLGLEEIWMSGFEESFQGNLMGNSWKNLKVMRWCQGSGDGGIQVWIEARLRKQVKLFAVSS
jgi:hypothetical protein